MATGSRCGQISRIQSASHFSRTAAEQAARAESGRCAESHRRFRCRDPCLAILTAHGNRPIPVADEQVRHVSAGLRPAAGRLPDRQRCRPGHVRAVLSRVRSVSPKAHPRSLSYLPAGSLADRQGPIAAAARSEGKQRRTAIRPGPRRTHSGGKEAAVIIGGWRGPGWQVFDADPGSAARSGTGSAPPISGHDCPVDAADAALVVTELFGNAVMHGPAGGRVLVGYCLWREGARLVVCDGGGPGTPRLVHGGELAEGGRGLRVVGLARGPVGQLPPGRRPGGVVRFRAAAARRASDAWAWLHPSCPCATCPPPAAR